MFRLLSCVSLIGLTACLGLAQSQTPVPAAAAPANSRPARPPAPTRDPHNPTYVQAKELEYKGAKGSFRSEFDVIGSRYVEDGKVNGWRALLIENGKIVGLTQSFLWN